ncbi:MAG: hypothetical protein OXC11_02340 [Rhodospirillales bacterium]|nr:hypothetical protein [Rhodospirillales bacterium]
MRREQLMDLKQQVSDLHDCIPNLLVNDQSEFCRLDDGTLVKVPVTDVQATFADLRARARKLTDALAQVELRRSPGAGT